PITLYDARQPTYVGVQQITQPSPLIFTLLTLPKSVMVSTGISGSGIWLSSAHISCTCGGAMVARRCIPISSVTIADRVRHAGDTAFLPAWVQGVRYAVLFYRQCDTPALAVRSMWLR